MQQDGQRRIVRALGIAAAWVLCLPVAASAQTAPAMMVERTPHYTLNLAIGPVESMVSSMDAMHGQVGDVALNAVPMSHDMSKQSDHMDQGMAVNHRLEVHITQADSNSVVTDVNPTIRIIDKSSGESRDLPQVMGMYDSAMGMSDFHYGQNVFLPDGTYLVKVLIGPADAAEFRDVMVAATPMMAEHPMSPGASMGHDMSMTTETARDGRMFSQESAVTQALFRLVWGDNAAQEWVKQHNAALT